MCKLKNLAAIGALAASALLVTGTNGRAQSADPYLGELLTVPFNFCPRGWLQADGQALSISNYQSLYSLLGTTYGGDGTTTFNLPAIRPPVSANGQPLMVCVAVAGVYPSRP